LKADVPAFEEGTYWCRNCGAENSGHARYSETAYGSVSLSSVDEDETPQLGDDYDIHDYDNFDIYAYECGQCGHECSELSEVFTTKYTEPLVARQTLVRMLRDSEGYLDAMNKLEPITAKDEEGKEVLCNEKGD